MTRFLIDINVLIALIDPAHVQHEGVDCGRLLDPAQITDTYLLALASAHEGKLATFDQRLVISAVADGANAVHLIR